MGAYRDKETFALDDARNHGYGDGRKSGLNLAAGSLSIEPKTLDGLGTELNLLTRVERLERIAASVADLLHDSKDKLDVLQCGDALKVASFLVDDQLPQLEQDSGYFFLDSYNVYRLELEVDVVSVLTKVWGGAMTGQYAFGETIPMTNSWVRERLLARGVEKDEEFCEEVVAEVVSRMKIQGGQDG